MRCPFCNYNDSRVVDSRSVDDGASIRRRRECPDCGRRFTTYEKYEETPLVVNKKDGRRELFESKKLLNGLIKAFEKRPISYEKLRKWQTILSANCVCAVNRRCAAKLLASLL